jgi:hypothetical protein
VPVPLRVGDERRENLVQARAVSGRSVVFPLAPGEHVRTASGRVETAEDFRAVRFAKLATDATVRVLFRVEVVERVLELPRSIAVSAEERDEDRIPMNRASSYIVDE